MHKNDIVVELEDGTIANVEVQKIDEMQEELDTKKAELESTKEELDSAKTELDTAKTELEVAKSKISDQSELIAKLQAELESLKK